MLKVMVNTNCFNSVLSRVSRQSSRFVTNRWFSSNNDNYIEPDSCEPPIPLYQRYNETTEVKRARLLYQSRKRGMLENDLLLSTFAHRYLNTFDDQQLDIYDKLINSPSNDWDLYYWVVGKKDTPPAFENSIMNLLKEHAKNHSRENRTRQPPLY